MADSSNTGSDPLDMDAAVNAILINEDITDAPSDNEVTMEETPADEVTASEAAIRSDNPSAPDPDAEAALEEEVAEDEEADEEEVGPEAEPDDQEEPEEESEEEEEAPNAVLFTTEDGEEVTLEDAQRSYLRQADYTKKTQALSELTRQTQARGEQLEANHSVLAENLTLALNVLEPQLAELAGTDWNTLAQSDAYEYAEKRALFDQAQARYNGIVNASTALVEQQKARQGQHLQAKLAQEGEALRMALPELTDPKKGVALRNSLRDYGLAQGLSEAEAGGITDHRIVIMMNKARMFDEMSASGLTAAKKKLAKSPKKVINAGQPLTKSEKTARKVSESRARLKSTGSIDDAVNFLLGTG